MKNPKHNIPMRLCVQKNYVRKMCVRKYTKCIKDERKLLNELNKSECQRTRHRNSCIFAKMEMKKKEGKVEAIDIVVENN